MILWQALFLLPLLWSSVHSSSPEDSTAVATATVAISGHLVETDKMSNAPQNESKPPENHSTELPSIIIMTTLEVMQSELEDYSAGETKNGKNGLSKRIKHAKMLKVFCSLFNAFGGFLAVLSAFTETSDLEVISSMFKEVNKKLDNIARRIDDVESTVELQGLLSNYVPWHFSVINGIEKLEETYSAMAIEPDIRKRRIQAEHFIKFFEDNQIESNVKNLIRFTTESGSIFHKNIYSSLIKKAGCNVRRLTLIYEKVTRIVTSGSQLILAYRSFKHMDKPNLKEYLDVLFSLRQLFEARLWYCKETAIPRSKRTILGMLSENNRRPALKRIGKILSSNFPWYSWSVSLTRKSLNSHTKSVSGSQFYELKGMWPFGMSLVITWQGVNEASRCNRMLKANTIVFIDICKSCLKTYLYASRNMLTSIKCSEDKYPKIKNFMNLRFPVDMNRPNIKIPWIAVGFKTRGDPCKNACNNNGQCRVIPYTDQVQCFCYANYAGENCQTEISIDTEIEAMVLDLQVVYSDVFKTPSISSILIQGEDLSEQLRNMMQRLDEQFELTQILVKYINSLQKLDYLLELSFAYRKKAITVDAYNLRMKSFLSQNDVNFLFRQLANSLLAEGFSDRNGNDFFNTFKKMISLRRGACSVQYGNESSVLLDRLSRFDITAAEAILAHYHFESFYLDAEPKRNMISSAKQLVGDSQERMKRYVKYWESTSCPPLDVTYLSQTGCGAMLSFEGMKVKLTCDGGREAVPPLIECVSLEGKLEWNATVKCVPGWSVWGEWSSCSSTCGPGIQTRIRECFGETDNEYCPGSKTDTRACSNEDCCQAKFGKFKCPVGWCIDLSRVCDGTADCALDADESRTRCDYLRSGNRIALRHLASSFDWLSFRNTDRVTASSLRYGRAYLDRCIKTDRVTESEWRQCIDNSMLVYGSHNNGREGQSIRFGDRIALYYRKTYSHHRWFRCYSYYCITYTCEKSPGQFDFSYRGGCEPYEFVIANYEHPNSTEPVRNGDIVFIFNSDGALKGNGYWNEISLKKCSFAAIDSSQCKNIAWQIFIK